MQYKRIVLRQHGSANVFQLIEDELPEPKADEVRIRVLATNVAYTDILVREGLYPGIPKPPLTPGYSLIGMVDRLGTAVSNWQIGQRVAALTVIGSYSEFICLPATAVVPVPDAIDPSAAACLVLQYVTAYQLLHRIAQVQPGERVLIHGAAGAVGTALLQLGKLAGLSLYGTASTQQQVRVSQLGGIAIDYQRENVVDRIRELTGDGVDLVLDAVGGVHLIASYQTLQPNGRLINYGFQSILPSARTRLVKLGLHFLILTLLKVLPDRHKVEFYNISRLKWRCCMKRGCGWQRHGKF